MSAECEHEWSGFKYPSEWPTCLRCGVKWPGPPITPIPSGDE